MYNQNYDDYMQNILGYRSSNSMGNYNMPTMNTYNNEEYMKFQDEQSNGELEKLYPETYRLVNPMVIKVCEENVRPITEEALEQMTKTVRANFDGDGNVEINVKSELKNGDVINPRLKDTGRETRTLNYLDDLIRILIIKNLLTRPRPPYPPMPGPGPRPPYPPMPGPGPRPPYPPMPGPGPRPPYPPMPGPGPRPPYPPMPGPGPRPPYMRSEEYNINMSDNNYNEM